MPTLSFRLAAVSGAVLSLTGCLFSAGGGASSPTASTPTAVTLSGTSYKGPTAGATVCAYAIDNAATGRKGAKVAAQAGTAPALSDGCAVTSIDGSYTLVLPAGTTGSLLLESSGGTYCNDESLYNGATCAGGGVPVAMGAATLSTVVSTPPDGVVAATPITVLTTAATRAATGPLDATSFQAAYGTVAGSVGVTDTNPASDPKATGKLNTVLAGLATYLGVDTTLLDSVVGQVGAGTLKSTGSELPLEAQAALTCSPLAATDLSYPYTYTPSTMTWDPILMIPVFTPLPPVTVNQPAYSLGSTTCKASADGQTSSRFAWSVAIGSLLDGQVLNGTYLEYRYNDGACTSYASSASTPMTLQYTGTQAIPLSASQDPTRSQAGQATKLRVTLLPGGSLPLTEARVENHLYCRTQASATGTYNFQGYLTSSSSPLLNGSYSRLDGSAPIGVPTWLD